MPTQPELTPAPPLNPLEGWFGHHPTAALGLAVLSLLMSLILVTRMWFCHRKASFLKKLAWTFILLFLSLAGLRMVASSIR